MNITRVKIISTWFKADNSKRLIPQGEYHGYSFSSDPNLRDYDWLVVYDELSKFHTLEHLACPAEHTILVTQEPPTIKLYSPFYTRQFNYILTTHDNELILHPHWRRGEGCFLWLDGFSFDMHASYERPEKSLSISAVASGKAMKHTGHHLRYELLSYLQENIEGFDWYGYGMKSLKNKYDALSSHAYHVVIENYVKDYHWSEKIADALIHYCLPFYAGDAHLDKLLPAESFIRIPIDDHVEAARIIKDAIANDEYSKRLPAICKARQQLLEQNNLWQQIIKTIREHEAAAPQDWTPRVTKIQRRHRLRKRPWNALRALIHQIRCPLILWLKNKKDRKQKR